MDMLTPDIMLGVVIGKASLAGALRDGADIADRFVEEMEEGAELLASA